VVGRNQVSQRSYVGSLVVDRLKILDRSLWLCFVAVLRHNRAC
jgi:hypothetical protein